MIGQRKEWVQNVNDRIGKHTSIMVMMKSKWEVGNLEVSETSICAWPCTLHRQLETAYLKVTHWYAHTNWHWRWLLFGRSPDPFSGESVRLIFTRRRGSNGSHVCVWGTAASGVTIDRRQSSPHSNSSAVPSNLPTLCSPPHMLSPPPPPPPLTLACHPQPSLPLLSRPRLLLFSTPPSAEAQLQISSMFIKLLLPTQVRLRWRAGFTSCHYSSFS